MYFDDLVLGESYDIQPLRVRKEQVLAFAEEYDPLPIYLDETLTAQSMRHPADERMFGNRNLMAPGIMSYMMIWAEFIRISIWGQNIVSSKSTGFHWYRPVYAGDVIYGKALISGICCHNTDHGLVEVTTDVFNQHKHRVIHCISELRVRRDPEVAEVP